MNFRNRLQVFDEVYCYLLHLFRIRSYADFMKLMNAAAILNEAYWLLVEICRLHELHVVCPCACVLKRRHWLQVFVKFSAYMAVPLQMRRLHDVNGVSRYVHML